jgi:hypothetical protein
LVETNNSPSAKKNLKKEDHILIFSGETQKIENQK